MTDEQDLAAGAAELEKLANELDGKTYVCTLITGGGRRPCLQITDRAAMRRAENIYSDGTHFYWGWAELIAPIGNLAAAVAEINGVLQLLGGNR
jgi:hypothetical protein